MYLFPTSIFSSLPNQPQGQAPQYHDLQLILILYRQSCRDDGVDIDESRLPSSSATTSSTSMEAVETGMAHDVCSSSLPLRWYSGKALFLAEISKCINSMPTTLSTLRYLTSIRASGSTVFETFHLAALSIMISSFYLQHHAGLPLHRV